MTIQGRITSLLKRHPSFFIASVSNNYPLTIGQILKYQDILIWRGEGDGCMLTDLSNNQNLPWTNELVDGFLEKWDWHALSAYIVGRSWWYENLLKDYREYIDWHGLSLNFSLPWTAQMLETYGERLEWQAISANTAIPWSSALLAKYEDWIDFNFLSMNISSLWNDRFSYERSLMASQMDPFERLGIIEKYEDRLDWGQLNWDWTRGLDHRTCEAILSNLLDPMLP